MNGRFLLLAPALSLSAIVACGSGDEVTGEGGFHFSTTGAGGAGGSGVGGQATTTSTGGGGSACHEGDTCSVGGKLGGCALGKTQCGANGATCVGPAPAKETCNGVDDNCDGFADEACSVTVEVRHFDGTSTGALTTTAFPVGGKASLLPDAVFGADPGDGWMSVTSESPLPLLGLGVVVPSATPLPTHVLAPTAVAKAAQKTIFFPAYHFGEADGQEHTFSLVNDGSSDASVTLHVLPDGAPSETAVPVVIPAHGGRRDNAASLLANGAKQGTGWLSVDSDQPLIAYFEEWSSATDRAADAAWPAPAKKVTIPFAAVGGAYDTVLRLATRSALPVSVDVRVHAPGMTTASVKLMVNAGARGETSVGKDLFPGVFAGPTVAWLDLSGDGEVGVNALIVDSDHAGIALVGPVEALDTVHYIADAAAGDGVFTHVLLANPSDEAVGAVLEAFAADGTPLRRADVLVPASGAFAGTLGDLFGLATFDGFVRIASDAPITGGYARHDGLTGVGATALQRGQGGRAIVADVRSLLSPDRTQVTIIQPDRRAFTSAP